jgi:hypothetical protein
MAWTYATLTEAIQDYTQNSETTFVEYIPTFILQAEDRISKAVILPMNRKETAITITDGQNTATLPSDFLAPFELLMSVSGTYSSVSYVDVSFIRTAYPVVTQTGTPRLYSIYNDTKIILGPTPTSGITGTLNYFYKPASITVTSPSWLGTNAENCLLYGCLSEAYTYMKGEPELQKEYEGKFQAALSQLITLGEGMDMGDAYRFGEKRVPK